MRQFAKLCDVRDFDDPDVLRMLQDILPERDPRAHVERKVWEFAMLALFLEEAGRLHDGTSALAVGAGDERMVFWLANRMGRVVATDIYGEGSFAEREATATMLTDPASHAPFAYREDRLEVMYADARELPFGDAAFDVVFSLSSIEHFGGPRDVARAAREMGRVLKPGGHAVVVTECFVRLDPRETALADSAVRLLTLNHKRKGATPRRRLIEAFTPRELRTRIVAPSGLELVQELDVSVSPESWENLTVTYADGSLEPATGEFYPHVLLKSGRSVFTSACLPLRKAPAAA
ncbi:MAG: class I SAM-dependent methyltransferase [Thermoleophilaceae bacterium]